MLKSICLSAALVGAAMPAGVAGADAFEPALRTDAVSVYVCRPASSWFARMPSANSPVLHVSGVSLGELPWGACLQTFAPAGELELFVEPGKAGGWAFGRFGTRVETLAGSARVFTLEVVEVAPEDRGVAVQRNWIARFQEIGFAEAGPGLAKLRAGESPAGR